MKTPLRRIKKKPISIREARADAYGIIEALAYYDAEAAESFSDLTSYTRPCDIERVEKEFYKIIEKLHSSSILKDKK